MAQRERTRRKEPGVFGHSLYDAGECISINIIQSERGLKVGAPGDEGGDGVMGEWGGGG